MPGLFDGSIWIMVVRDSVYTQRDCDLLISNLDISTRDTENCNGGSFQKRLDECLQLWMQRKPCDLKERLYKILKDSNFNYIVQTLEDELAEENGS
uniref:Death domain-containing protein n=1 Tax=Octopus bimaculoides TaxID=37653 RepID=A0A0L8HRI3_OCTBM